MREEKMQILKMIEEGKITTEEGIELLEALETREETESSILDSPKWMRIRVFDPDDSTKVNVNVPVSLLNVMMKVSNKFVPELKDNGLDEEDFKEILQAIQNGAEGKIVDIESDNGEKVEIIVE